MCDVVWWWLVVVDTHTYMYSMIIHKWLDVIRPPWLPGGDRSPTLEGCVRHIPLECSHECVQPPTIRKMCHCVNTEIQSMYSEYGTSWKCQQVSWNLLCVLTLHYTSWKLGYVSWNCIHVSWMVVWCLENANMCLEIVYMYLDRWCGVLKMPICVLKV